jgi:hypothetical protein
MTRDDRSTEQLLEQSRWCKILGPGKIHNCETLARDLPLCAVMGLESCLTVPFNVLSIAHVHFYLVWELSHCAVMWPERCPRYRYINYVSWPTVQLYVLRDVSCVEIYSTLRELSYYEVIRPERYPRYRNIDYITCPTVKLYALRDVPSIDICFLWAVTLQSTVICPDRCLIYCSIHYVHSS